MPTAAPPADALPGGLVHVSDGMPGLQRVRRGKAFAYRDAAGHWLRDPERLRQIRALAIPPAYTDVWICPLPNGHLQATGRDARGRKQYRYHPDFRSQREDHKFERLAGFGRALPRIRARVEADLRQPAGARPSRGQVLATVVHLLDTTCVRVGNDEYARGNRSFGLTTLRNRHAGVEGCRLKLRFRGKHGVMQECTLEDPRVARVVRRCQQLPGQELFEWVDDDGQLHDVGSGDVNDYLEQAAGARFTAKDFRTWHGSVHALELLRRAFEAQPGPLQVAPIVREVAQRLGNTAAVCRKAYIHPAVLALAQDEDPGRLRRCLAAPARAHGGLSAAERRLLRLLDQRPPRGTRLAHGKRRH